MNKTHLLSIALMSAYSAGISAQQVAAHFDMSVENGKITESVSHNQYSIDNHGVICTADGLMGKALRLDGYSTYVKAALPVSGLSTDELTFTVLLAAETYPMMKTSEAETTPTYGTVCGNLNESTKQGIALQLSSQGDLRFYWGSASGYQLSLTGTTKLPIGGWHRVTVTLSKSGNQAVMYLDGSQIGSGRMSRASMVHSTGTFYIGKDGSELKEGPFHLNAFCGLIDDIAIYNSVVDINTLTAGDNLAQLPDFSYPAERYAGNLWRPTYHAMPSGSWTNETHGMYYSGGRYHVFFQKNPNGPYMARLHWGHISSENLYSWREEPIAIAPGESYDIKGCWSGCVYDDGGVPTLLYTAVDNAKAVIAKATANDENLYGWTKQGVIVNGRPSGLSDDFRDPYHFTVGGQEYVIVGTSKNGIGACTLHKRQGSNWTNDGSIFFQGGNVSQHGTFWEMPNITDMGDGRWLFTCTPLGTGVGVRTLCWVGTIGSDGKFTPTSSVQYLEMNGVSRDGYGLLSPTIYQKDGKTILLGIVPDKLPTNSNYEMGWAHNYSLPRELSIDANGQLVQRPWSLLAAMRDTKAEVAQTLDGAASLSPVSGRQIELLGEFKVQGGDMGFRFLKSGNRYASLTYQSSTGMLTLDLTQLDRQANDNGVYAGKYNVALPEQVVTGGTLKLQVYVDGSIADIFVNDRWAYSVRLFPTNAGQTEAEVFTTTATEVKVQAWTLDPTKQVTEGIADVAIDTYDTHNGIYDLQGRRLASIPTRGLYIKDGKKYVAH